MKVFNSLLPFMDDIARTEPFLREWQGGIEMNTDGPHWQDHPMEWHQERERFSDYPGPLAVHSPIFELNLATPRYPAIAQYAFEVYKQSLVWSAEIGAEHMVIHPNLHSVPIYDRPRTQRVAKEYLKQLGDLACALNVKLVVENVGYGQTALFNPEEFVRLFEEIETVYALVDVGHAHINGWETPALLKQLGTRLAAVHLHDNHGDEDEHLPIGEGTIEWRPIWEALDACFHEVSLILEYNVGTPVEVLLEHGRALRAHKRLVP